MSRITALSLLCVLAWGGGRSAVAVEPPKVTPPDPVPTIYIGEFSTPVRTDVTTLDLSRETVADGDLKQVAALKNLTSLWSSPRIVDSGKAV